MALQVFCATDYIGGGTGALDKLDGDILADKDTALVITLSSLEFAPYCLDDDAGGGEESPLKIEPNQNAGTKRWILTGGVFSGLDLYGPNASVSGPHLNFRTSADIYPVMQILNYQHDNMSIGFDSYYDGTIRSSDVGSNARIQKVTDKLFIKYDSGVAQGAEINWNDALVIDLTTGYVGFGEAGPLSPAHLTKAADAAFRIEHTSDLSYGRLIFYENATLQGTVLSVGSNYATAARRNNLEITSANGGDIVLQQDGVNKVGINVDEPGEMLDVGGNTNVTGVYKVDDVQVVSSRVIDARIDDTPNSGDATTDGIIAALQAAVQTHGLVAAA